MKDFEKELFGPILNVMKNDERGTRKFWGRFFNHYCTSNIFESRYNSFNTRSSVETLEFRLLKFKNAEQYIRACDFCIDTTRYINTFIGRNDFNVQDAIKLGETIAKKYKEVIQSVSSCANE